MNKQRIIKKANQPAKRINQQKKKDNKETAHKTSSFLSVSTSTWLKDSNNLFDYQINKGNETQAILASMINQATNNSSKLLNLDSQLLSNKGHVHKNYQFSIKTNRLCIYRNNKTHQSICRADKYIKGQENQEKAQIGQIAKTDKQQSLIASIKIGPNYQTQKLSLQFQNLPIYIKKDQLISHQIPSVVVSKEIGKQKTQKGYPIKPGHIIFFGRAKYLVRQSSIGGKISKFRQQTSQILENFNNLVKKPIIDQYKLEYKQIDKKEESKMEQSKKYEQRDTFQECQTTFQLFKNVDPKDNVTIQCKKQQTQEKIKAEQEQVLQCRICYSNIESSDNPLLNLCNCTGSCQFTHLQCLKEWLRNRIILNDREHSLTISRMECEICKAYVPMSTNLGKENRQTQIITFDTPKGDYLMLQKMDKTQKNIIILKNMPYQGITFGRDNSCYIKINDVSVSRVHAEIKLDRNAGHFLIFDRGSKFGTTVASSEWPFKLDVGGFPRALQIGRTTIQLVVKKKVVGILDDISL